MKLVDGYNKGEDRVDGNDLKLYLISSSAKASLVVCGNGTQTQAYVHIDN